MTECLYPVIELTVSAKTFDYSAIIHLDNVIRDHHVPAVLNFEAINQSSVRALAMQQGLVRCGTEISKYFHLIMLCVIHST